jgi:hypothetical protein
MEVWLLKKSRTCIHYDARARSQEAEIRARPNGPTFVPQFGWGLVVVPVR